MVEKVKKGHQIYCITALLCIVLASASFSLAQQASFDISSKYNEPDEPELVAQENDDDEVPAEDEPSAAPITQSPRRISNIIIKGNKYTSSQAITNLIPYKIGEI